MAEVYFQHAGTRLFAVDDGRGTPIILLHGGLATHAAVVRFAAPLAARFRLIAPDLRGSGRSHDPGPLAWDQLADDVAALARHLGIARAVIGGISFGAACAVRVALRHPALTSALVLLHPAFAGDEHALAPAQRAAMDAMDAAGSRAIAEGIAVVLPLFDALPVELRARARALVATYDPASVAATTRFMASGAQPFARAAELAAITAPVLLVPGIDPQHPREVADVYRASLARCTTREVPPADFATAIAELMELVAAELA